MKLIYNILKITSPITTYLLYNLHENNKIKSKNNIIYKKNKCMICNKNNSENKFVCIGCSQIWCY